MAVGFRRFAKFSALFVVVVASFGCSAQEPARGTRLDPQAKLRIERQVREFFRLPPQIQVEAGELRASEFPGYDAVDITLSGGGRSQTLQFQLSKDGKTLLRVNKLDLTKDPYQETMDKIDLKGRAIRGNKDAKVTIVNYDDFQCPVCSQMHMQLKSILAQYGDRIRLVYKDFPLMSIHPWARRAAVDANCLAQQNPDAYWDFADLVHANARTIGNSRGQLQQSYDALDKYTTEVGGKRQLDSAKLQKCIQDQPDSAVNQSLAEGDALGVDGTPTLFINGQRISGLMDEGDLAALIRQHLQEQGKATAPLQAKEAIPAQEQRKEVAPVKDQGNEANKIKPAPVK